MATLLKAREVCNVIELDRIPEGLTELMDEFGEGAKQPAFVQEFLLGSHSMGTSEGLLRNMCDKARVRRADLSQWDLLPLIQKDGSFGTSFGKSSEGICETKHTSY